MRATTRKVVGIIFRFIVWDLAQPVLTWEYWHRCGETVQSQLEEDSICTPTRGLVPHTLKLTDYMALCGIATPARYGSLIKMILRDR